MIDGGAVAVGIFIVSNVGTLIWGAATVKTQLSNVQRELERQGRVLEGLADVKIEMRTITERAMLQGRRIDDLTAMIMSHLMGERAAVAINESAKG